MAHLFVLIGVLSALDLIKMMIKATDRNMRRDMLDMTELMDWIHEHVPLSSKEGGIQLPFCFLGLCARSPSQQCSEDPQHPQIVTHMSADVTRKGGEGKWRREQVHLQTALSR